MRQTIRGHWTERKARTATLRLLGEVRDRLIEIGGLWGDVDQYLVDFADAEMERVDQFKAEYSKYWEERDEERKAGETA